MDKLIFLGTGHALAYHCYSTCLALTDGTHTFMTDAGAATVCSGRWNAPDSPQATSPIFSFPTATPTISSAPSGSCASSVTALTAVVRSPSLSTAKRACSEILRSCCDMLLGTNAAKHLDKEIFFRPVSDGESRNIGPWQVTFFDTGAGKTVQYGWRARLTKRRIPRLPRRRTAD